MLASKKATDAAFFSVNSSISIFRSCGSSSRTKIELVPIRDSAMRSPSVGDNARAFYDASRRFGGHLDTCRDGRSRRARLFEIEQTCTLFVELSLADTHKYREPF
jgi:hypothetical protein